MTPTATLASVLAGSILLAVCPTAVGQDAFTRSFVATVAAEVQFAGGGTGIYSPDGPCPASVFGIRLGPQDLVYYQGGRQTTNLKTGDVAYFGTGTFPLAPCPLPGSPPTVVALELEPLDAFGPYHGLSIEQVLQCAPCVADPATALAVLYHCPLASVAFANPAVPDGLGVLGGTALEGLVLSRSISCTAPANFIAYYDGAAGGALGYCDDWVFGGDRWGTGDCFIQAEDIVPYGNGVDDTGYVIICMQTPAPAGGFLVSHDYVLVLDWDDWTDIAPGPDTWYAAQFVHNDPLGAIRAPGWHDLGGDNGCPDAAAFPAPLPAPPARDFLGSFPEFP